MTTENNVSIRDRVTHFLSDMNDAPEYGYQDNAVTGVGFWMMQGARYAINLYKRGEKSPSAFDGTIQKMTACFIATITSPFTAVGAILKGVGSLFPTRIANLTIDQIHKTAPDKVDQIYELLKIVDDELRQNRIEYSMDGGTLLGAVRHQGIIPWDDDADLIIMKEDKARFLALKDRLKAKGIDVEDTGFESYKLTFDAQTLRSRFSLAGKDAANLDILVMEKGSDGIIRNASDYFKDTFPKEYFLEDEWQQRRDYSFGPPDKRLVLKGPVNPMRYLKTYYGPECMEYALQTHSHIQVPFLSVPLAIVNFSKTRYKIVNPTYAVGNAWKNA